MSLELQGYPGIKARVTNKMGVEHIVIGTCHVVNKQAIQDPDIQKIIEKSSLLYTELGPYSFITSAHGSIPESDHKYRYIPFRFHYDMAFRMAAWAKKIPNESLNALVPGAQEQMEEELREMRALGPNEVERRLFEGRIEEGYYAEGDGGFNAWSRGDPKYLEKSRQNECDHTSRYREMYWAKTLIPTLQTASKTICIAVGAFHVVGDGLLARFKEAGLKVEVIPPKISSRL